MRHIMIVTRPTVPAMAVTIQDCLSELIDTGDLQLFKDCSASIKCKDC